MVAVADVLTRCVSCTAALLNLVLVAVNELRPTHKLLLPYSSPFAIFSRSALIACRRCFGGRALRISVTRRFASEILSRFILSVRASEERPRRSWRPRLGVVMVWVG